MNNDVRAAGEFLRGLAPKVQTAIRRSLKRTGTTVRAEMARAIVQETFLPSTRIKNEIKVVDLAPMVISVEIGADVRIPLIEFHARGPEPSRGRGRGVTWRLRGSQGRAPHAFIATMSTGHRGVFVRRPGVGRHPVVELHGPSLAKVFEKYLPQGETRALEVLQKNLDHEMAFALKG